MSVRKAVALAMVATAALMLGLVGKAQAEAQSRLVYSFEQGFMTEPPSDQQYVVDAVGYRTGYPHQGYLEEANGGTVDLVRKPAGGTAAKFPEPCVPTPTAGCPKAMVRTDPARSDDLNPGTAPFAFGADLLMEPSQLSGGSNVVQKGLSGDPGGQWKLQVDNLPGEEGEPSCSVRGVVDGELVRPVYVEAWKVDVADGNWHRVVCRRTTGDRLAIIVDGVWQNSEPVPTGATIGNDAPVTVGAKRIDLADNDQFHGTLDRVFFRLD